MILQQLRLQNFRNYPSRTLDFHPKLTYISGKNAQGKTNILEAIHVLLTGKGIKGDAQEELISFQEQSADIYGTFAPETELRVHLETNGYSRKVFFINKARKQAYTYLRDVAPVVLFTPELISIIDDSPSFRRNFFDSVLCKIDLKYQKTLRNYENGLRKRNKVLESQTDTSKLQDSLAFWNDYLIEQAEYIQEKRREIVEMFNSGKTVPTHSFQISLQQNAISHERFEEYFMKEYYQKRTLIGPQRDEYTIELAKGGKLSAIDTKKFASRGEQRLALFWLILNQLSIYNSSLELPPILLLDDIFSELDDENQHVIAETISSFQTVITGLDDDPARFIDSEFATQVAG